MELMKVIVQYHITPMKLAQFWEYSSEKDWYDKDTWDVPTEHLLHNEDTFGNLYVLCISG